MYHSIIYKNVHSKKQVIKITKMMRELEWSKS